MVNQSHGSTGAQQQAMPEAFALAAIEFGRESKRGRPGECSSAVHSHVVAPLDAPPETRFNPNTGNTTGRQQHYLTV
jgi:hypothetical protein